MLQNSLEKSHQMLQNSLEKSHQMLQNSLEKCIFAAKIKMVCHDAKKKNIRNFNELEG